MSQLIQTTPTEFRFDSELKRYLAKFFTDRELTHRNIADALGWDVCKVSGYRSDRCRLTNDDAKTLSNYLNSLGGDTTPEQLIKMQKTGVYVDLVEVDRNFRNLFGLE
ncbi:hypothetical protein [Moraxella sp. ZY200743]|uniref:hypothetical protein n=1 Tax=Moraxella sp. ZY200743 TaxID=2911970 RepID=UPI003D7DCBDE